MTPAATARQIARDLNRLYPDWRDPERYFENRDELRRRMQQLARALEETRG